MCQINSKLLVLFIIFASSITNSDNKISRVRSSTIFPFYHPVRALGTPLLVTTNNGNVRGRVVRAANGRYAREFLNIPYAQAPLGALRFVAPQPVIDWWQQREHDGTKLGHACMQTRSTDFFKPTIFQTEPDPTTLSEDCLNLNIHTPYYYDQNSSSSNANLLLPVLIWIHGGGFQWGGNNMAIYNASILATEINAVVVVINYRLGAFGFLTLDGVSGNQGLLDQLLAVKWVRNNARHFDGDAEQITLIGESAGSASVQFHLFSALSRPLFARAIMQSGSAASYWAHHSRPKALQQTRAYLNAANCDFVNNEQKRFSCFQSKTSREVLTAFGHMQAETNSEVLVCTTDGVFLTKSPLEYLAAGDFKRAPVIVGTVANESLAFLESSYPFLKLYKKNDGLTARAYRSTLRSLTFFSDEFVQNAAASAYSSRMVASSADNDALVRKRLRILAAISDDVTMNNGMMETLEAYVDAEVPVFRFSFNHVASVPLWHHTFSSAVHGDQLPFVLGHVLDPKLGYSEKEIALARKILRAIGNFIRSGSPNLNFTSLPNDTDATPFEWRPYENRTEYFTWAADDYGKIGFGPQHWRTYFWRHIEKDLYWKWIYCTNTLNVQILLLVLCKLFFLVAYFRFRTKPINFTQGTRV